MNCDDYEIISCPSCKAKLRISYSVDVDVDVDIDVEKEEGKENSYPSCKFLELREAPTFIVDTSTIPFTGDQTEYFAPVVHDGVDWWTNGHTLFCGQPLAVMHKGNPKTSLQWDTIASIIASCTNEQHVECVPERADDYCVLMTWAETCGATLRSTVEICARRWPTGTWFVQRTGTTPLLDRFSYWIDGDLVCSSMGFLNEEFAGKL